MLFSLQVFQLPGNTVIVADYNADEVGGQGGGQAKLHHAVLVLPQRRHV